MKTTKKAQLERRERILSLAKEGFDLNQISLLEGVSVGSVRAHIVRDKRRRGVVFPKTQKRGFWKSQEGRKQLSETAAKYSSRKEFRSGSSAEYHAAMRLKIIPDICSHMQPKGNYKQRFVYVLKGTISGQKCLYVGMTYDPSVRLRSHHMLKKMPDLRVIWQSDLMDVGKAATLEKHLIKRLRASIGDRCANTSDGGEVGSVRTKMTRELAEEAAVRCKNPSEFIRHHAGAYNYSKEQGFYKELIYSNGERGQIKSKGYWQTEEGVAEAISLAKQAHNSTAFIQEHNSAYRQLKKLGIFKKYITNNKRTKMPKGFWSTEEGISEAVMLRSRFGTITEFASDYAGAYDRMRIDGNLHLIA